MPELMLNGIPATVTTSVIVWIIEDVSSVGPIKLAATFFTLGRLPIKVWTISRRSRWSDHKDTATKDWTAS